MRIRRPILGVAAVLLAMAVFAAPASAAVQNVVVSFGDDPNNQATTTEAGETVRYNIAFQLPTGLDGGEGQFITVDASAGAAGTAFPPLVPSPGGQIYLLRVVAPTPGPLAGPSDQVVLSNSNQTVQIPVDGFEASPGDTVLLSIPGVRSPYVTGMKTLSVSTINDAAGVSAAYEVTQGPGAVVVESGSDQSAQAGEAFADPLQAKVLDGDGNPESGVEVTFTAPGSGPSGTFADGGTTTDTATTDGSGIATSSTLTANGQRGAWEATASTAGTHTPATFELRNETGPPAAIQLTLGDDELVGNGVSSITATAHVEDAFGNPVSGEDVEITTDGTQDVSDVSGGANGNYSAFITSSASQVQEMATITATDTTPNPDLTDAKTLTQTADTKGPSVVITAKPNARTKKKNVKFAFEPQAPDTDSLECKLDKDNWEACSSPREYKVKVGKHKFKVRGTDLAGNTGDPDRFKFERIKR